MINIKELYSIINQHQIGLYEVNLPVSHVKGFCYGSMILMNKNIDSHAEYKCTLAEEIGHQLKSYGNIMDYQDTKSYKQEIIARRWSYEKLLPLHKFVEAYKHGCRNRYEAADFLDVTEKFLEETVNYYKVKYGVLVQLGNYFISFDPLGVMTFSEL